MIVNGEAMFPLCKLKGLGVGNSYFLSINGEVWSMQSGSPRRLNGSITRADQRLVFTLIGLRGPVTVRHDKLIRMAKDHPDWTNDTRHQEQSLAKALGLKTAPKDEPMNQHTQRAHAESVDAGIRARGWVIGSVKDGALSFGEQPRIHVSEESVDAELARLAGLNIGVKFVKLQIKAAAVADGLTWE